MEIWKDIEIEHAGETHIIKPSLDFINRLESRTGRSITAFVLKIASRDIPVAWSSEIVAVALNYAGVKITADEVYAKYGMNPDLVSLSSMIILACLPPQKTTKTSGREAEVDTGKPPKPTGEKSTE